MPQKRNISKKYVYGGIQMLKAEAIPKKASSEILVNSLFFIAVSFIMTDTYVNGFISPFNAVVAASVSPIYSTAVLTGSLMFCFFTGNIIDSLALIGAITVIVIARWIFDNSTLLFKSFTAAMSMFSSSVASMLVMNKTKGLVIALCTSILTGIAVYFLSDIFSSDIKKIQLSGTKGCSYAIICILFITSFSALNFSYFNIGRIIGVFLMLVAARQYKHYGGAICGIFTTCGTMLCSYELGTNSVFFGSAGMITGFFYEFNRLVFGIFFISVNILGFMLTGFDDGSARMLCDVMVGTLLFWIIPEKVYKIYLPDDSEKDELPLKFTSSGINSAVAVLSDIRKDSQSIVNLLNRDDSNRTLKSVVVKERQKVLFEQMKIAEDILLSVCSNITGNMKYDSRATETVKLCIDERKIKYNSAVAYRNESGRIFVDILSDRILSDKCCENIRKDMSEMFFKNFEYSEKLTNDDKYSILLSEKTKYFVECFHSQYYENEKSGDTTISFDDGQGNTYLVISDGMGSGNYAAVDSQITVNLFKRLIMGGIDVVTAINMINSIMLSKSSEESFATLDVSKVNLDTGEVTIIKSGASATLIKHDDSVMMVCGSSLPIGILGNTEPFIRKFKLNPGDSIIMLSDGVSEKSYQYIKTLMLEKDAELSSISKRICRNARNLFKSRSDDVTVLASKIILQN